jgi:hypothetical protein
MPCRGCHRRLFDIYGLRYAERLRFDRAAAPIAPHPRCDQRHYIPMGTDARGRLTLLQELPVANRQEVIICRPPKFPGATGGSGQRQQRHAFIGTEGNVFPWVTQVTTKTATCHYSARPTHDQRVRLQGMAGGSAETMFPGIRPFQRHV